MLSMRCLLVLWTRTLRQDLVHCIEPYNILPRNMDFLEHLCFLFHICRYTSTFFTLCITKPSPVECQIYPCKFCSFLVHYFSSRPVDTSLSYITPQTGFCRMNIIIAAAHVTKVSLVRIC